MLICVQARAYTENICAQIRGSQEDKQGAPSPQAGLEEKGFIFLSESVAPRAGDCGIIVTKLFGFTTAQSCLLSEISYIRDTSSFN